LEEQRSPLLAVNKSRVTALKTTATGSSLSNLLGWRGPACHCGFTGSMNSPVPAPAAPGQ